MDGKAIQEFLRTKGLYDGLIDDIIGKKSLAAIDQMFPQATSWPDARKLIAAEQAVYAAAGIPVGTVDGLVGEQTRYARSVWEARKVGDKTVETWHDEEAATPLVVPTPPAPATRWPREAEVPTFFGQHGTRQVAIDLPFPMRIAWEPEKTVNRVQCHEKVRAAFGRIWLGVKNHYGLDEVRRLRLDMFGGCFNERLKRGSATQWSMHSWGIAWDVDPDRNQLKWKRAQATLDDPPYAKFWEIVEGEGMTSLGRTRDFDWQHFQAARL